MQRVIKVLMNGYIRENGEKSMLDVAMMIFKSFIVTAGV